MKVSRCTVQEVIRKKIETENIKDRKKSGRTTKLTKSDYKYLKITSLRNRTKSCHELDSDLTLTSPTQIYPSIIRKALMKEGLHGRVAIRKHYLRQGNRKTTWICQRTQKMDCQKMDKCIMEWWIKIWNFQFKEKTVCKKGWRVDERCVLEAYN